MSDVKEELQKGAFVNFLGILGRVSGPGLLIVANQLYGTATFGIYMTANIIVELTLAFLVSGFKAGNIIFVSRHADDPAEHKRMYQALSTAFVLCVGIGVLLIALMHLLAPFIFPLVYEPEYADSLIPLLKWMVIMLPFMAFEQLTVSSTQGLKTMKFDAIVNGGFKPFFLLLFAVVFYYLDSTVMGLAYGYVVAQFLVFLYSLYIYTLRFSWKELRLAIRHFKPDIELIRFAIPQNLNTTLNRFTTGVDILMLPALGASSLLVGYYATGSLIVREIRHVKLAFSGAFNPHIVRYYKEGDIKGLSTSFSLTANWIASITIPIILIIAILRNDLMEWISNAPVEETLFMLFLLPVPYLYNSFALAEDIITMTGHSLYTLLNSFLVTIFNVGLNLWLIPEFGLTGAAMASAMATFIIVILENIEVRYLTGAKLKFKTVYKPHLAGYIITGIFVYTQFYHSLLMDSVGERLLLGLYLTIGFALIYILLDFPLVKKRFKEWGEKRN